MGLAGRLRQKDDELKAHLGYTVSSRPSEVIEQDPLSKELTTKNCYKTVGV